MLVYFANEVFCFRALFWKIYCLNYTIFDRKIEIPNSKVLSRCKYAIIFIGN